MLFFLSRTAHESLQAYRKRAAETIRAAGADDYPRQPFARGATIAHPESGRVIGYVAYTV